MQNVDILDDLAFKNQALIDVLNLCLASIDEVQDDLKGFEYNRLNNVLKYATSELALNNQMLDHINSQSTKKAQKKIVLS